MAFGCSDQYSVAIRWQWSFFKFRIPHSTAFATGEKSAKRKKRKNMNFHIIYIKSVLNSVYTEVYNMMLCNFTLHFTSSQPWILLGTPKNNNRHQLGSPPNIHQAIHWCAELSHSRLSSVCIKVIEEGMWQWWNNLIWCPRHSRDTWMKMCWFRLHY